MVMIDAYTAGKMTVGDETYRKDLKIVKGQVVPRWWRKNGHLLETADMKDILGAHPEVVVVGTGYASNMDIDPKLQSTLEQENIKLIAENTHKATETFNQLHSEGKNVAGAFHLTC